MGLTAYTRPVKSPVTRLRTSAWPMVSWRRLAPMTATERGLKNFSIEADSARCSRSDHQPDGGVGGVDRELELEHALVVLAGDAVAGVAEGLDHPGVVGQHLGDEPLDAALAARLGEVLEQQLADPAALVLVLDQEGDLGLARLDHVVAPDRDDPALEGQHERDPVDVVDVGEAVDVALGEPRHRREEAVVLRLVRDPGVELDEDLAVLGPDRPDVGGPPVAEQDVGLPVPRGREGLTSWAPAVRVAVTREIYRV